MAPLVQIVNLEKTFGAVRALDRVNFQVAEGEWIAIMGPSGSGKTTLINILGGLDHPTAGSVIVAGTEISNLAERELTRYRSEKIGFVFQQFHLVPYLTALENVMLAQYFHSITDETEAAAALRKVGLADRQDHLPSQLSGGEQQRVAIARALINQPKLILADEPTGNLDEVNEAIVLNLLRELHSAGHTILVVTHSQAIGNLADRRIELEHGRLARITTPGRSGDTASGEEQGFDATLERFWLCEEQGGGEDAGAPAAAGARAAPDTGRAFERMAALGLIEPGDRSAGAMNYRLADRGRLRARDLVRRRRLAERLLMDALSMDGSAAASEACKFEQIIGRDLERKICTFLNHPKTCPHGHAIPAGDCCPAR